MNGAYRPPPLATVARPDQFRTTGMRTSTLNAGLRRPHLEAEKVDLFNGVGFAAIDLGSLREGGELHEVGAPSLDWTCT
jgi:hypothetical protein